MSAQLMKKATEDVEIEMIKPTETSETPQTADELWEMAEKDDIPFLDAWKARATDLGIAKNAMWLSAIYEFVLVHKQMKKFKNKLVSGNEAKELISFVKQKDALLKRIADIERRHQIMGKDCPMKMVDTSEGEEDQEGVPKLNF